jgi:uncharacterized protein (TIRG00374 family)
MNKYLKTAFFIIGLGVFAWLISDFGISNIIENVRKSGWWFVPVVGVWGVVYYLNAWAWYYVIDAKNKKVGFANIYGITLSGFAINYITPFVNLGGEPYRVIALKDKIGLHSAVSSVILYTMLHFLSHFIFWTTAIILAGVLLPLATGLKITLFSAFVILLAFIWFTFTRHKKGIFASLINLLSKLPFLKSLHKRLSKKEESLLKIDEQIKQLYNERKNHFYLALFFEYSARIVASLEFLFILKAIGISISFLEAFYINAGSSLIINLFFFMPFELGTREGGLYLVLDSLKLTPGVGIYIGLVNRVREFFWILVGLVLIQFNGKKKEKITKNIFEYMSEDASR